MSIVTTKLPPAIKRTLGEQFILNVNALPAENLLLKGGVANCMPLHQALVAALVASEKHLVIKALTSRARETDGEHDHHHRCLYQLIDLAILVAEGAPDREDALRLKGIQAKLFPDGRAAINHSWQEEAGAAAPKAASLTEAEVARLARLNVEGLTAAELLRKWVAAAEALGALLDQRSQVGAVQDSEQSTHAAGIAWSNGFDALLGALPISGLDAMTQTSLLRPFEDALKAHYRRQASRAQEDEAEGTGDDGAPRPGLLPERDEHGVR